MSREFTEKEPEKTESAKETPNRTYVVGNTQMGTIYKGDESIDVFKSIINEFEKQYEKDKVPYNIVYAGFVVNEQSSKDQKIQDFVKLLGDKMGERGEGFGLTTLTKDSKPAMINKVPIPGYPDRTQDVKLSVEKDNNGKPMVHYDRVTSSGRGIPVDIRADRTNTVIDTSGNVHWEWCSDGKSMGFKDRTGFNDHGEYKTSSLHKDMQKPAVLLVGQEKAEVTDFVAGLGPTKQKAEEEQKQAPEKAEPVKTEPKAVPKKVKPAKVEPIKDEPIKIEPLEADLSAEPVEKEPVAKEEKPKAKPAKTTTEKAEPEAKKPAGTANRESQVGVSDVMQVDFDSLKTMSPEQVEAVYLKMLANLNALNVSAEEKATLQGYIESIFVDVKGNTLSGATSRGRSTPAPKKEVATQEMSDESKAAGAAFLLLREKQLKAGETAVAEITVVNNGVETLYKVNVTQGSDGIANYKVERQEDKQQKTEKKKTDTQQKTSKQKASANKSPEKEKPLDKQLEFESNVRDSTIAGLELRATEAYAIESERAGAKAMMKGVDLNSLKNMGPDDMFRIEIMQCTMRSNLYALNISPQERASLKGLMDNIFDATRSAIKIKEEIEPQPVKAKNLKEKESKDKDLDVYKLPVEQRPLDKQQDCATNARNSSIAWLEMRASDLYKVEESRAPAKALIQGIDLNSLKTMGGKDAKKIEEMYKKMQSNLDAQKNIPDSERGTLQNYIDEIFHYTLKNIELDAKQQKVQEDKVKGLSDEQLKAEVEKVLIKNGSTKETDAFLDAAQKRYDKIELESLRYAKVVANVGDKPVEVKIFGVKDKVCPKNPDKRPYTFADKDGNLTVTVPDITPLTENCPQGVQPQSPLKVLSDCYGPGKFASANQISEVNKPPENLLRHGLNVQEGQELPAIINQTQMSTLSAVAMGQSRKLMEQAMQQQEAKKDVNQEQ